MNEEWFNDFKKNKIENITVFKPPQRLQSSNV